MSVFTHHRRFHKGRHWHYFNQSEKSPGSLAELLWRQRHTESTQIAGYRAYCQPFSSQLSKAKTSEGQFQSQIDHSTQGKPLKKASRRPREQNASLCSGRVHGVGLYRTRPPRKPAARGSPSAVRIALAGGGRLARRQTTWGGPYRPTPFVRRPHVARNTNRIFDIYLIRNLWTLLESWLVSVKLGRVY